MDRPGLEKGQLLGIAQAITTVELEDSQYDVEEPEKNYSKRTMLGREIYFGVYNLVTIHCGKWPTKVRRLRAIVQWPN